MEKRYTERDFNRLNNRDKVILSSLMGVKLASRVGSQYKICLFWLNNYYVETWLNKKKDEILHVRTFTQIVNLDPYLSEIEIPKAVQ